MGGLFADPKAITDRHHWNMLRDVLGLIAMLAVRWA